MALINGHALYFDVVALLEKHGNPIPKHVTGLTLTFEKNALAKMSLDVMLEQEGEPVLEGE